MARIEYAQISHMSLWKLQKKKKANKEKTHSFESRVVNCMKALLRQFNFK